MERLRFAKSWCRTKPRNLLEYQAAKNNFHGFRIKIKIEKNIFKSLAFFIQGLYVYVFVRLA